MKRLLVPFVALAFLSGTATALRAESPCCEKQECPAKADARYTKELLDILQTTHSVDAFVVTLHLLVETDVDPHTAIPLIVRHAERLGVFADSLAQDEEDEDKAFTLVIEVLHKFSERVHPTLPVPMPAVGASCEPACGGCCDACECHCRDKCKADDTNELRTPILPPLKEGSATDCSWPPDDAVVLRALPNLCHAPGVCDECRDHVEIVKEQIVNKVDEPRFYPLVGPAQLHHSQWKCTVYCDETIKGTHPCVYRVEQPHVAVVYIDKDHLHLYKPEDKHPEPVVAPPSAFLFWTGFYR